MDKELSKTEKAAVNAWVKYGSKAAAAKHLGLPPSTLRTQITAAENKGWKFPLEKFEVPENMKFDKTTVHYKNGEVIQEWRRMSQERAFSTAFVEKLIEKVRGKGKVPKVKKKGDQNLMAELCAYDLHFGMYASVEETGDANYDTNIAADRFLNATSHLISKLHNPSLIRLVLGGDQLHADNNSAKTPHSGNSLDVDQRYSIVIKKLVAACREAVAMACSIAPEVEIYVVPGNHDPNSSLWLAHVLEGYYFFCDNVTVCNQATPRKYATWGNCLSVYGHGNGPRADKWAGIVAAERADLWGKTKYRYARLGHIHTKKVIAPIVVDEASGLEVTYLASLASSDAWHAEMGYIGNNRGMQAFELDKETGEDASYKYNI